MKMPQIVMWLMGSLAVGLVATAAPIPKLTLYTHWFAQPEDGGFYTALLKGYWREEGIDVEIVQGGANANVEKRVSLDPQSLGITPAEQVVQGVAHELPLVSVVNFFQYDPQCLMVHESGFAPYRIVATHAALVRKHPEWVRAFARGTYRGWLEFAQRPGPALDEICRVSPQNDRGAADFAVAKIRELHFIEGFKDRGESFGANNPERWKSLVHQLAELGIVPPTLQPESLYNDTWLPSKVGISEVEISRAVGN
jgi:ABC-type nitrate/sulfonate/bicarbonate transport system substrate-binding protein